MKSLRRWHKRALLWDSCGKHLPENAGDKPFDLLFSPGTPLPGISRHLKNRSVQFRSWMTARSGGNFSGDKLAGIL